MFQITSFALQRTTPIDSFLLRKYTYISGKVRALLWEIVIGIK